MKKLFFVIPVLLFVFSCGKYEDGPSFSLRTKTHRLANSWKVESVTEDGVNVTTSFNNLYPDYLITISKSNTYVLTYKLNSGIEYKESGTWVYSGDKKHVYFNSAVGGPASDWLILRLKEKELWTEHTDSSQSPNHTYEVHFIPAF